MPNTFKLGDLHTLIHILFCDLIECLAVPISQKVNITQTSMDHGKIATHPAASIAPDDTSKFAWQLC
jgi:hypothetical protein